MFLVRHPYRDWEQKAGEKRVFCATVGHSPIFYSVFSSFVFQGKEIALANW